MATNDQYKIIMTPYAQRDVDLACYDMPNDMVIKFIEEIESHVLRLQEYPFSCPLLSHSLIADKNMRKLVINKNYVALYTVQEANQLVYIIGIFNTFRDYIQLLTFERTQ